MALAYAWFLFMKEFNGVAVDVFSPHFTQRIYSRVILRITHEC